MAKGGNFKTLPAPTRDQGFANGGGVPRAPTPRGKNGKQFNKSPAGPNVQSRAHGGAIKATGGAGQYDHGRIRAKENSQEGAGHSNNLAKGGSVKKLQGMEGSGHANKLPGTRGERAIERSGRGHGREGSMSEEAFDKQQQGLKKGGKVKC